MTKNIVFAFAVFASAPAWCAPSVLEIGYVPSGTEEAPPLTEPLAGGDDAQNLQSLLEDETIVAPEPSAAEPDEAAAEQAQPETAEAVEPEAIPEERTTKITSKTTIYNRKEGIALFDGDVHLDDSQYQMHADKVYLFFEGTNDIKRVVALGNVALTNEMRRAYGTKASYTKANGLVVLYGGDGIAAEVRDESKTPAQSVKGGKIRFWIDSEQVEVIGAEISGQAPSGAGGTDAIKKALGK